MIDSTFVWASASYGTDTAGTAATVGAGLVEGDFVVDVSAIEVASNDEKYKISMQGAKHSSFATYSDLAILELGALEVLGGNEDSSTGRYVLPFRNERNGTYYPRIRPYVNVSGSIASPTAGGITFSAFIQPRVR